jgi:hypothetical protein
MTTVRKPPHNRAAPTKKPAIATAGVIAAVLLGVVATLWSVGALRPPVQLEQAETTQHVTDPPTREEGLLPEAIFERYDDCIVNAAAFCSGSPDA